MSAYASSAMRTEAFWRALRQAGLPPAQRDVLMCLNETAAHKTGVCPPTARRELAARSGVSPNTVTAALAAAEARGLITPLEERVSRRSVAYAITPERLREAAAEEGTVAQPEEGTVAQPVGHILGHRVAHIGPRWPNAPHSDPSPRAKSEAFTEGTEGQKEAKARIARAREASPLEPSAPVPRADCNEPSDGVDVRAVPDPRSLPMEEQLQFSAHPDAYRLVLAATDALERRYFARAEFDRLERAAGWLAESQEFRDGWIDEQSLLAAVADDAGALDWGAFFGTPKALRHTLDKAMRARRAREAPAQAASSKESGPAWIARAEQTLIRMSEQNDSDEEEERDDTG